MFVSTMLAMMLMLLTATELYKVTDRGMYNVKQLQYRTQAKYLAEAGLSKALASLRSSWSSSTTYASASLGTGTYQATVSTVSGRTKIVSTGTVSGISRTVSAEVTPPVGTAMDYVFAAGGNADIDSGTGQSPGAITGSIYAGGNVDLDGPSSGGSLVINGDVDAGGNITVDASVTLNGTTDDSAATVTFPTVSFPYYQAISTANGQTISGNQTYTTASPIPASVPGGVIYVTGNVTIRGTQTSTVCLVVGGNIDINKSGSTYPRVSITGPTVSGAQYPSVLCGGNLTYSSTGNGGAYLRLNGLTRVNGNITFTSGNHDELTIVGSAQALGNITLSPTAWNAVTATYSAINSPGITSGSASMELVSYNS